MKTPEQQPERSDKNVGELDAELKRKRELYAHAKELERLLTNRGISLESAREMLGEDFLGSDSVRKAFGFEVEDVPEIPFSVEELERAKRIGQMLVLRVDKTKDGKPLSMEAMNEIVTEKGETGLLNTAEAWKDHVTGEEAFKKETPRAGWALTSKEVLSGSTSKNYVEQTEILVTSLREDVFADIGVPEEYEEAIQEFESNKDRLTQLMSEDWQKAAKELSELKISQLTRASIQETIYDLALYYHTHKKRLLENTYTWSNSLSRYGGLISLGEFVADGVGGGGWVPDSRGGDLGVSLSRRS